MLYEVITARPVPAGQDRRGLRARLGVLFRAGGRDPGAVLLCQGNGYIGGCHATTGEASLTERQKEEFIKFAKEVV